MTSEIKEIPTIKQLFVNGEHKELMECYDKEYAEIVFEKDIKPLIKTWLKQQRERLFIPTVSSMDCQLSGAVEDTFDELEEDLEK